MKTDGHEDIRIISITGENIRKLTTIAVKLDGGPGLFRITSGGENEEGKTTVLDIAAMLFGGKKAVKPGTIQFGKDGGWAHAELTNGFGIMREFNAKHPDGFLTLTDPEGKKLKAGQGIIDGWVGKTSFDPGGILKQRTSDIEAAILRLAKDPDLKGRREGIARQRDQFLAERTPLNSALQKASRTKKPDGECPAPVDVSGEMEKLKGLMVAQVERQRLTNEVLRLEGEASRIEEEVQKLKDRLSQNQSAMIEAEEVRDLTSDRAEEIAAVEARISEADEINTKREPWAEYDRAQSSYREYGSKAEALTAKIKALDAEEEALLKAAEIPVDGITFSEEGDMLLDGFSIEVASGMRRLRMACDMAYAENSDVKVCLLDEADAYSQKSIEEAHRVAKEKGFQVFACQLGKDGPGEIVVRDGAVTGGN